MSDIDYHRLPKELKHPTRVAIDNGWTVRQATQNGYRIDSPGKTENFYVPFKTGNATTEARHLMQKVTRSGLTEDTPESKRLIEELADPKNMNATLECSECDREFLSSEGYEAHWEGCMEAMRARLAAERAASKAITQPEVDEPSQGRAAPPVEQVSQLADSSGSGKLANKEEDSMGGTEGGYKRGPYGRREIVKPGLSRALYEAMRTRSRHQDETLSVYANTIAAMIEQPGTEEYRLLDESESKLARIIDILGMDPEMSGKFEELVQENERLHTNLKTLKELFNGI